MSAASRVTEADVERLAALVGLPIDPDDRAAVAAALAGLLDAATLVITIREGRNRQIRKMCEAIGHPVLRLTRVAIGPIRDPRLPTGRWRDLTAAEVQKLQTAAAET